MDVGSKSSIRQQDGVFLPGHTITLASSRIAIDRLENLPPLPLEFASGVGGQREYQLAGVLAAEKPEQGFGEVRDVAVYHVLARE